MKMKQHGNYICTCNKQFQAKHFDSALSRPHTRRLVAGDKATYSSVLQNRVLQVALK